MKFILTKKVKNVMKDKIIFWLDAGSIINFGIAKYLQEKHECDMFAIIDITNRPKEFFVSQQLVKFQKVWYYHDHINKKYKNPDLSYLTNFEKNHKIGLWEMSYNDRIFYRYNEYHKFSRDEILSILEQECRLFESVLDHVKPDFFITSETALRHHHLFYRMCKAKKIKILMLNHANFEHLCYISEERHKIDYFDSLDNINGNKRNSDELQKRIESFDLSKHLENYFKKQRSSLHDKLRAAFQFLIVSNNSNIKTHHPYLGRTKILVLIKEVINTVKKRYRKSFINRNLCYDIEDNKPFIFFPLHQEPERSLLIAAPFYTNQLETILHVVKSIPIEYVLYVKEHPSQGPSRGWRSISFYKKIMEMPNVKLIHPSIPSKKLFQKCSLVISVGGTSCFEAAFFQKPSIMFADLSYSKLPSVYKINSLEELPKTILVALQTKVEADDVDKYVTMLENNSFNFDFIEFDTKIHNWFYYEGNLVDIDIPIKKMEEFLIEHKSEFELLVNEHLKKITQHKENGAKLLSQ